MDTGITRRPRTLTAAARSCVPGGARLCVLVAVTCVLTSPASTQASFQELMSRARRLQSVGNLRAASAQYSSAVEAAPGDEERAEALIAHASVVRSLDRDEQAEEQLRRAVAVPGASAHLRRAAMFQLAALLEEHDRVDEAIELYTDLADAITDQPDQSADALISAAQLLCDAERYQEARGILEKLPPDKLLGHQRTQAASLLIQALIGLGDIDAVGQAIDRAGLSATDAAHQYVRLAHALLGRGQADGAAAACQAALQADPGNRVAWRTQYEIAVQQGTLEELRAELAAQLDDDPENLLTIEHLASLAEWSDAPGQALDVYRKLVALRPEDAAVLERAGSLAAAAGSTQEALGFYQAALRLDPDDVGLHYVIGDVYAKTGDLEAAVEAWKKGTVFRPGDLQATRRLGDLLAQHGLYEEAARAYRECREQLGDQTVLAAEMAQALVALLRPGDALGEYVAAASAGFDQAELVAAEAIKLAQEAGLLDELMNRTRADLEATGAPGLALLLAMAEAKEGRVQQAVDDAAAAGLGLDELITVGESLEFDGMRDAAAGIYASVATNDASSGGLRLEMGLRAAEMHAGAGRTEDAAAILRQATGTAAGPDHLRDRAVLLLANLDLISGANVEQARQAFASLASESSVPRVAEEARWRLADCAFAAGDFEQAIALYQELAARVPPQDIALPPAPPMPVPLQDPLLLRHMLVDVEAGDPRMTPAYAFSQIAEAAFRSGDLERAKALFAQVAEDYPQSIYANDAVERRAFIATHFARPRPAVEKYLQALAAGSGDDWERSIEVLDEIAAWGEAESLADDAALLAAALLDGHGRRREAADRFRALPQDHPTSLVAPEALLRAARLARALGDEEQAKEDLEAIVQNFAQAPMAKTAALWLDDLQQGRPWTRR